MTFRLRLWQEGSDAPPLLDFPVAPRYVAKLAALLERVRPALEAGYVAARAAASAADAAEGIVSMLEMLGERTRRPSRGRR